MLALKNAIKEDSISGNKCKNIRKSWNEIDKILAKSKSWHLLKFRSESLSIPKNIENISIIRELDFLTCNPRVALTELKNLIYLIANVLTI